MNFLCVLLRVYLFVWCIFMCCVCISAREFASVNVSVFCVCIFVCVYLFVCSLAFTSV